MISLVILLAAAISPPPGPDAINAVLGDISAQHLRPGERLDETARIATHLTYIEQRLRATPVGHLSPAQQTRRRRVLDRLRAYRTRAVFPRNTHVPVRRPVFVDGAGRRCAVAALAEPELGPATIESIARRHRLAYIGQIDDPALPRWAADHGFTIDELAMIQPAYMPPLRVEKRRTVDLLARARTRLAEDWRFCAGAAWHGRPDFDLPEMRTEIVFFPVRGYLGARAVLTPKTPPAEAQAQTVGEFMACVEHSLAGRRFYPAADIEPGRAYPIRHDLPRGTLLNKGRPNRAAVSALMVQVARAGEPCEGERGYHGTWSVRAQILPDGGVKGLRVSPHQRQKADRAMGRCLRRNLEASLGWALPTERPLRVKGRFTIGVDPAQIELREQGGMAHGESARRAHGDLNADWAACRAERYPRDGGYILRGVQPELVFEPDGARHRAKVRFAYHPDAPFGPRTEALDAVMRCAVKRFDQRRFHLDSGVPGKVYAGQPWFSNEGPVDHTGAIDRFAFEAYLKHLARTLAGECPVDRPQSVGWQVTVDAAPGGRLAGLTVENLDPHGPPAAATCLEAALRSRIRLPPVTRRSSATARVQLLPPWFDETRRPYTPPPIP